MPASARNSNQNHAMENIIVGGIALLLFIYLFMAMIRPEKF
jgi:K+-transporting ATPase KdpF subunit